MITNIKRTEEQIVVTVDGDYINDSHIRLLEEMADKDLKIAEGTKNLREFHAIMRKARGID